MLKSATSVKRWSAKMRAPDSACACACGDESCCVAGRTPPPTSAADTWISWLMKCSMPVTDSATLFANTLSMSSSSTCSSTARPLNSSTIFASSAFCLCLDDIDDDVPNMLPRLSLPTSLPRR
jgi:hypothetical protein